MVWRLQEDAAALGLGPLECIQLALHQRYRALAFAIVKDATPEQAVAVAANDAGDFLGQVLLWVCVALLVLGGWNKVLAPRRS